MKHAWFSWATPTSILSPAWCAAALVASLVSGCGSTTVAEDDAATDVDASVAMLDDAATSTLDAGCTSSAACATGEQCVRGACVPLDDAAPAPSDAFTRRDVFVASRDVSCATTPPAGAATPPPLPAYSGGSCPTLVAGRNQMMSSTRMREFLLVVPSGYDAATEHLPIIVMWHWLQGSANGFLTRGAVQQAADRQRFIALIPESAGDLEISILGRSFDPLWPFLASASAARVEEEAVFFDDMLSCTAAQFSVNENCISTTGVSAGALWTSQLMQVRANRIANAIVLSGGTGPATRLGAQFGLDVRPWTGASRPVPTLVLWGGPTDTCAVDFQRASWNLEGGLTTNGHFMLECVHNCGHSVPPIESADGFEVFWRFALDHPYWLAAGESPYFVNGLPAGTPEWCGIGMGGSTPRTASCGAAGFEAACDVPAI